MSLVAGCLKLLLPPTAYWWQWEQLGRVSFGPGRPQNRLRASYLLCSGWSGFRAPHTPLSSSQEPGWGLAPAFLQPLQSIWWVCCRGTEHAASIVAGFELRLFCIVATCFRIHHHGRSFWLPFGGPLTKPSSIACEWLPHKSHDKTGAR